MFILIKVLNSLESGPEFMPLFGTAEIELIISCYHQLCSYSITQSEYNAIRDCCIVGTPLEIMDPVFLRLLLQVVSTSNSVFCRELLLQDLLACMSNEKKKSNMK